MLHEGRFETMKRVCNHAPDGSMSMLFPWDWTQHVQVSERVVFVEWRRRPPPAWYTSRGLSSIELDTFLDEPPSIAHTIRTAHVLESHRQQLRPRHQLCISIVLPLHDSLVRTRALCILGCFTLLHHHMSTSADAWIPFCHLHVRPFLAPDLSPIHVIDCLRGLEKARANSFLHDHDLHQPTTFTWISKKLLALPRPSAVAAPLDMFIPYFQSHNVTLVLSLHGPCYSHDSSIEYMDLTTSDDEPPDVILARVLDAIESTPGVVAVHGIDRGAGGVFVGGYLMRTYDFSAREAAGWLHLTNVGVFPPVLARWERLWKQTPDAATAAPVRVNTADSLKINIGGISFGTSLLAPKEKVPPIKKRMSSGKKLGRSLDSGGLGEHSGSGRNVLSRERAKAQAT
ncbi:Aste57867_20696 [Aphanomyces stellatus]|uniref:Aste57867_20696 protein n=1 Tax=Aphanomyces stellatus TaxID=120398 RepID=A0A485LGA2_9STRA|nr:hypothetical protein As57867_020628 [Aphanomyces stellatus]VFT97376.1 Aste57867_20696 [Aphanomyces stellatus]